MMADEHPVLHIPLAAFDLHPAVQVPSVEDRFAAFLLPANSLEQIARHANVIGFVLLQRRRGLDADVAGVTAIVNDAHHAEKIRFLHQTIAANP